MKKSRLERLIGQLNPKELKNLRKFIDSPYFNQQQNLVNLLDYCIANKEKVLDRKAAYKAIFPNKPFKETDFRLQMSYLYRLIEKFIAYTEIEADEFLLLQKTITGFNLRNLPTYTLRILKKATAFKEKQLLRNATYFENSYQINLAQYGFDAKLKPTEEYSTFNFRELDITYYITKLKTACLLLSQQTIYQSTYDLSSLDHIISQIRKENLLSVPAVATYYYCYLTLTQPNEINHFDQFNRLILTHNTHFSAIENRDLYLLAINYCIKQINQGNTLFYEKTYDLYKAGLDTQALLENNILSRFTYHNIVLAGIRNKELDWVDAFIHQYQKNLEKRYQESSFSYSRAHLAYHRKNYAEVLELLQTANYRDVLLNLGAKTLLLKVYYELSEFTLLHAHLEAMKNFIRRKRVIGYHKTNYMNIVRFTQKLLQLNFYDKAEVVILKEKIETAEVLTEKKWLLEQL